MGGPELEPPFAFTDVIDVAWLVDFAAGKVMAERKGVVPASQGLPPEAKVSITELRKTTYSHGLSVAILSYCCRQAPLCPHRGAAAQAPASVAVGGQRDSSER